MAIYIVRPQQLRPSAAVSFAATRLTADRRKDQIQAVSQCRIEDPVDGELRRWLKDAKDEVDQVSLNEGHTPVTGTTVLEMSPEQAARLESEVAGLSVLRDQPIDLIRPSKAQAAAKAGVVDSDLWHLRAIGLAAARRGGFKGTGDGVTIAVMDTGIDDTHGEIRGRVSESVKFDVASWRAIPQQTSVDTDGHGTHVAGLVAGRKVGVAPGVKLRNGIMIPKGRGNLSDFVLAIEWAAAEEEVQILNMSAGIRGFVSELLPEAIEGLIAVGVLPVVATGNEARNRTRSPGNYDSVLSVGASNEAGRVASFSSSGVIVIGAHQYTVPDLVAPGESVTSCVMGGGYEAWNGTSMATPIVSGIASLALERWPQISVAELTDEILRHCLDLKEPPTRQGAGLAQVPPGLKPSRRKAANGAAAARRKQRKARSKKKVIRKRFAARRKPARKRVTAQRKPRPQR